MILGSLNRRARVRDCEFIQTLVGVKPERKPLIVGSELQ